MREQITPYKGHNNLNYLCVIATELLGENHLRNIPTLAAGFDSILNTLPPNVAQAIRNIRLSGIMPWSMRELRLMTEEYRSTHQRQEAQRHWMTPRLWGEDEEPQGDLPEWDDLSDSGGKAAVVPARFHIDDQFNVRRSWTNIMPDDIREAIRSLTTPLPVRMRAARVMHDPKSSATIRNQRAKYEAWIEPIDFLPPPLPLLDVLRTGRAPGLVKWADLVAVADRFDRIDEIAGRQKAGDRNWFHRLHSQDGRPTAVLLKTGGEGLIGADELDLVGIKHLIGLPGAGKTTLLYLLAAWMHERGYRVCFLFPSIEVSTGFIEQLAQYEVRCALLFGQSERARAKHVANFASALSQDNKGYAVTRHASQFYSTNCALAGYASEEDTPFPHDQPPCQTVEQRRSSDPLKKPARNAKTEIKGGIRNRQCALSTVCGRQYAERELVNASVWAGHILSTDRQVSPLFSDAHLRQFELIARTFDLVVVDECDGSQANLDARGTPLMKLSGDADSVWNHLLMDLHAPAAQGRNAFVAGSTIPTIMAMSGRFGIAAERLTASIIHSSPQFRKEMSSKLLTSLSILADMYPDPKLDDDASWSDENQERDETVTDHRRALQAMERMWDIAAKRVAFRDHPDLILEADQEDKEDGIWGSTTEEGGGETTLADPKELENLAKLARTSAEEISSYLDRIFRALDRWDRDANDSSMRVFIDLLKEAPGLRHRKDDATFFELGKLLAHVGLLVLQHFGLAPHLRLLNAQGILGDDVFESRPSRELLAIVPESLAGRLSGVRFTVGDEGDVDIAHIGFAGTPRLLIRRMIQLGGEGNESGAGTSVLLTSATSMMEQSPSYHINVGPHYVLQRPNAGDGWTKSRYFFLPLRDPIDERRMLFFSGSKLSRREHVLKTMCERLLADGVLGLVETAIRQNDVVEGVGRKAAFVVNSYEQCQLLFEHIRSHHPIWRHRIRYLVRGGSLDQIPEGGITASEVERLGEDREWDLFIFPMNAIGRGVNIVYKFGPRTGKAMIGSLFFLTRPHPRADSLSFLQGIIGRESEEFDTSTYGDLDAALAALRERRKKAAGAVSHLLRMPQAARALGAYAKPFVADQMIMILQTIGRTMRGDCPAFAYFVDAAWAPYSAMKRRDTSRSSMLLMMKEVLEECLNHPNAAERECYENLYRTFYSPLSNIDGVCSE